MLDEQIDRIIAKFKGKGGDEEAECILVDNNTDRKEGYVSVWGCNHNIAKIAERCRKDIIRIDENCDGASLYIKRRAFRGVVYAFRNTKEN
tara:strand:- start:645 stop:917 length:273 start_codon:yes stop_codon:yes gene_type:complete